MATLPFQTQAQIFAFIGEMTSTRNLLAYGIRVLKNAPFFDTTLDPILTMLSIGVEKYFKLTIGVIALADTGAWPSSAVMKEHRHGIFGMWEHVRREVGARVATGNAYLAGLLMDVDIDDMLPAILEVLDRYGRSGRFYNLDMLGDNPQHELSPEQMWNGVTEAAHADPTSQAKFTAAMTDLTNNEAWDEYHRAVCARVAQSLEGMWEMLSRIGMHGVLGETGRTLGFEVRASSVGRQ